MPWKYLKNKNKNALILIKVSFTKVNYDIRLKVWEKNICNHVYWSIVECDILHLKMLDINVEYLGTNPQKIGRKNWMKIHWKKKKNKQNQQLQHMFVEQFILILKITHTHTHTYIYNLFFYFYFFVSPIRIICTWLLTQERERERVYYA
jgi:hypothetical protein